MTPTDSARLKVIVDGFLRGDSAQFRIIQSKITQYIYHQNFGDDSDRDEIISEIIEILYDNLSHNRFRGDSISALNVYIYSIIRHRIVRALRRRARLSYTDKGFDHRPDESPNPEDVAAAREIAEKVLSEIDQKCAELLKLKFQLGYSDQEIADKVKKSKNATSTAITRCLQKAKDLKVIRDLV